MSKAKENDTMSEDTSNEFTCKVVAFGAWGKGFENWEELSALISDAQAEPTAAALGSKGPKPEVIPANERRRSPLPVKLAVETSWQATQMAEMDPKALSCVFVSGFGDTQLTDYMCKVLASDSKELSPTKFHNSVHNAAAGYWTISTGCEQAANSVAGFQDSVSLTLMEAMIQCQQENKAILLTFFDAPVSEVLTDIMGPGSAFAFSMIIAPASEPTTTASSVLLTAEVQAQTSAWPDLKCGNPLLVDYYQNNPSARILSLVELLQGIGEGERSFPMGTHSSLYLARA